MRINLFRLWSAHAAALAFGLLATPIAALGQATSPAQVASRFAGNWVEDLSQRKTGGLRNLTFRKGATGLEEVRGWYSRPLVESVRFDTAPYTFGEADATMAWKQLGGGHFERTVTDHGKTLNIRHISISPDGKTLTEVMELNRPDGTKSTTTTVYARTSGSGQNLDAVWEAQTLHSDTPFRLSIQDLGGMLKATTGSGITLDLTFDGKPVGVTGPGVISGTTTAGKIVSDRAIEIDNARLGTPTSTATWTLSPDGKTLTSSILGLGPDATKEPSVSVYLKQ
jgi:hypothetical protein